MASQRKRLLIVDGYNVLRSGERYQRLLSRDPGPNPDYDDDAFNRAREMLINDVVSYAGRDARAVIVFDGNRPPEQRGEDQYVAGVRIVFSTAGSSADKVIEKLSREAREKGIETMVVTSDATIQNTVFGLGVDRMSANGFGHAVDVSIHEYELDRTPEVKAKYTLGDRLDASTAAKLAALRDRLSSDE
jgi:predicted RNA-binding protein with PIN domain